MLAKIISTNMLKGKEFKSLKFQINAVLYGNKLYKGMNEWFTDIA